MTKKAKIITGSAIGGALLLYGVGKIATGITEQVPSTTETGTSVTIVTSVSSDTITSISEAITQVIMEAITEAETEEITQAPIVSTASKTDVVYIAVSGNGQKYHSHPNCSGMNGDVIEMTKEKAIAQGYEPCGRACCYGG